MAELTLLMPERERVPGDAPAAVLRAWIGRGDRLAGIAAGRDAALRSCFEFAGTSIPFAALTRSLDANDAASALWLRADPAWVVADAVTLRLLACGDMQLSAAECETLARELKPLFGDAGFPLEPATPARWYLRCPPGTQLPAFSPPAAALGDDVGRHLPQGDDGRRWRHLLNEAQVILHNHPLNAERVRRGIAPVNSLWIWGAGMLPDWVRTPFTDVRSDDEVVRALSGLAGVSAATLADGLPAETGDGTNALIDLGALRDVAACERDWLQPAQEALAAGRIGAVELRFADGERRRYRHRHRWRFWRRVPAAST